LELYGPTCYWIPPEILANASFEPDRIWEYWSIQIVRLYIAGIWLVMVWSVASAIALSLRRTTFKQKARLARKAMGGTNTLQKSRTFLEYFAGKQLADGKDQIGAPSSSRQVEHVPTPRYDVALSFAGEDRGRARSIAHLLVAAKLSVFYDEYEQSSLWGRNLYTHLSDVYQNKAKYCLMFISEFYAKKLWTKREREAAQARAFRESIEYILPLRLDDTEMPGIDPTVAYVDLRQTSDEQVVRLILEKLCKE
jgi:hypothetical protein